MQLLRTSQMCGYIKSLSLGRVGFSTLNKTGGQGILSKEFPITGGFRYEEINKFKSLQIRSLLGELFESNIDDGFQMAYSNFLEAVSQADQQYLQKICDDKLLLSMSLGRPQLQLYKDELSCQDLIYTDITLKVGDRQAKLATSLQLFGLVNIDVYGQNVELSNAVMQIETYILSPLSLTKPCKKDSRYHRVLFETDILEEMDKPPDVISLALMSAKKRKQYISNHFFGKSFEWCIKEIDQYTS
ncbi:hypothetical protein pb186bvf_015943 [Paramecium bursaria]